MAADHANWVWRSQRGVLPGEHPAGALADPDAGAAAARFYEEWPVTKQALNTAIERLGMMSDDIMTVNTNIQSAGGNL